MERWEVPDFLVARLNFDYKYRNLLLGNRAFEATHQGEKGIVEFLFFVSIDI